MDTLVSAQAERMGVSPGAFSILLILLAALLLAGHALHFSPASKFLSQGALALLAGLGAGGCLYLYFEGIKKTRIPSTFVAFQYDVYMDLFLPPIIFYAGFSIKKKHFFENIGALMSLGVLGTAVNAALLAVAAEVGLRVFGLAAHERVGNALALGALFAATDSVAALSALDAATYPGLHALVFGEAVTNDATAIVLLKALQPIRTEAQLTTVVLARMVGEFCKLATMRCARLDSSRK
jgi:NhaP-type Na+/H+ or K+/H+ antiporter